MSKKKAKWLCTWWDDDKDCEAKVGCNSWEAVEILRARVFRRFGRNISVELRKGETKPFDTTSPCGDPNVTVMARDAETGEPTMFIKRLK